MPSDGVFFPKLPGPVSDPAPRGGPRRLRVRAFGVQTPFPPRARCDAELVTSSAFIRLYIRSSHKQMPSDAFGAVGTMMS